VVFAARRLSAAGALLALLWLPTSGGTVQPAVKTESVQARVSLDLSHGWRFRQGDDLSDVPSGSFDDSQWSQVELPHTWNPPGQRGHRTIGTHQCRAGRRLVPAPVRNTSCADGEALLSSVRRRRSHRGRLVERTLSRPACGSFFSIPFRRLGRHESLRRDLLVVKADNSRPQPGSTTENVIPLSADFFVFGGIYRSVALITTDPVHVDMLDFGGPGLYARARDHRLKLRGRTRVGQAGERWIDSSGGLGRDPNRKRRQCGCRHAIEPDVRIARAACDHQ
jgi:beta-galactosidase